MKWFEMVQTGLPMCTFGSFLAPLRLKRRYKKQHIERHFEYNCTFTDITKYMVFFLFTVNKKNCQEFIYHGLFTQAIEPTFL